MRLFRSKKNEGKGAMDYVRTTNRTPSTEAIHRGRESRVESGYIGDYYEPKKSPDHVSSSSNPSSYAWSQHTLTLTSPDNSPFPRYGAGINSVASRDGKIYMFGGLVDTEIMKGDLWVIEDTGSGWSCSSIKQTQSPLDRPGPRVGHASLLVGNAYIVFGGDTKVRKYDTLDDTLYFMHTDSHKWSRLTPDFSPPCRYGHTMNFLGTRIYIFGGQAEGHFFNDLVAFDLSDIHNPKPRWEHHISDFFDDIRLPADRIPAARTNHTVISHGEKLYLFGGTNGVLWFNDVWVYDPQDNTWTEVDCIGNKPLPMEGHAAALVNDVMYVFGGRAKNGADLRDLYAFRITERRWYTVDKRAFAPSARSGHRMTAYGRLIILMAGEPSTGISLSKDLGVVHILDTAELEFRDDLHAAQNQNVVVHAPKALLPNSLAVPNENFHSKNYRGRQDSFIKSLEFPPKPQRRPGYPTPKEREAKNSPASPQAQPPRGQGIQSPHSLDSEGSDDRSQTVKGDNRLLNQEVATKQERVSSPKPVHDIEPAVSQVISSLALPIRSVVDLVRDSHLETEEELGFTKHVVWVSNRNTRQRRVRREELWKREHELGNGSYGRVWLESCTEEKDTKRLRAVKEITKSARDTRMEYERELEALAKFSNEKYVHCFVEFFGWWETSRAIFISMEYVPDGDLQRLLTASFAEPITWEIAAQILEGLAFMHENGFTHRDLKPGNILVLQQSPAWWVKITDFGITKRALESTALRTFVGTHGYLAPEVIGFVDISEAQDPSYTSAVDIWALGEITFRLITNQSTFPKPRALARYCAAQTPFPQEELDRMGASTQVKHFLEMTMAAQPSERPSAQEAMRHPWIARSRPPSGELSPNIAVAEQISEVYTFAEPSNRWSASFDSASIATSRMDA